MDGPFRRARIIKAIGHPIGNAKPPLNLAQSKNPSVRRQLAAVKHGDNRLPTNRGRTTQRKRRINHGGYGFPKRRDEALEHFHNE